MFALIFYSSYTVFEEIKWVLSKFYANKTKLLVYLTVVMQIKHFKVARYSFSGSIPPTFERKLRRHKQRFGKIDTTVVLDKDENLLSSGLQWHQSYHSNEMRPLPILLAAWFLGTGNCSSKIVYWNFFLQQPPRCSWSLSEICKSVIKIFWEQVFMVRNR